MLILLLSMLSPENLFAAKSPPLGPWLTGLCRHVVAVASEPREPREREQLFEATLFQEIPLFHAVHPEGNIFRKLALEFTDQQVADGMPAQFAQQGVAHITEHLWYPEMTPSDYRKVLENSIAENEPLRRTRKQSLVKLPWGTIPVNPKSELLKGTVTNFVKSGLPIYAASAGAFVELQIVEMERVVRTAMEAGRLDPATDTDAMTVMTGLVGGLDHYGQYVPAQTPRGIVLANFFNLAAPSEHLLHEITHVSQDFSWNLIALVLYFNKYVRGVYEKLKDVETEVIKDLYQTGRDHFQRLTADPQHRAEALALGDQFKFTPVEWIAFFDFHVLLTEIDAHQQAMILGRESGRRDHTFSSEPLIFEHVIALYYEKNRELSPLVEVLLDDSRAIFQTVDWLNDSREFRVPGARGINP